MRIPATSADYLDLIQKGLPPRGGAAQEVLVLGAGMAGPRPAAEIHLAQGVP